MQLSGVSRLSDLRRFVFTRWGIALALTGCAGIVLRVWAYRSPIGVPSADDGILGLMTLHALHGHFTTFYWGSPYCGSQEALLTVPVFWLFGPSWLALRIVPMVLTAVAAALIWRVGRRTIGEPAATVAGALFWIWPPFAIYKLTHQTGQYTSGVIYAVLLLLLALRVVERPSRVRVGLLGLVLGLAFWQTSQIVPIAVPVIAWMIWKQPRCLRHVWLAAPLAVLGALPWIVWNAHHGWQSLSYASQGQSTYAHRLRLFVSPLLPMALGLRTSGTQERLLPGALTYLIYAILLGAFVYGAVKALRRNTALLYLVVLVFPFLYAISRWTYTDSEPRYLMVLMPLLALLVAQVAKRFSVAVVLLASAAAITIVNLDRMNTFARLPQTYPPPTRTYAPLISALDRLGIDRAYAGAEFAYQLDFEAKERIIAVGNESRLVFAHGQVTPTAGPGIRWPAYDRAVRSSVHAFVFYRQRVRASTVVPQLLRYGYRAYPAGPFVVYARR
jgi:dolichyl-phosphate-mannose-protein mannosyltransferase